MIRDVDLVSYLPTFMQEYKEPVIALKTEKPEFCVVWKAADRVLHNHFISTADEYGISNLKSYLAFIQTQMTLWRVDDQGCRVSGLIRYPIPFGCCCKS